MNETSKAAGRRHAAGWYDRYMVGRGIDIGCGDDPVTATCERWDLPQGDAQELAGVDAETYDWLYSSHCLEHMVDARRALSRWWEVLKPGGYLLLAVPDEDLYEQEVFPSRWNPDHKHTFTVSKTGSWSPVSLNLADLLLALPGRQLVSVATIDCGYDYRLRGVDQTMTGAEAAVEAVVRKLP